MKFASEKGGGKTREIKSMFRVVMEQVKGELALHVTQRVLNPVKDVNLITFCV